MKAPTLLLAAVSSILSAQPAEQAQPCSSQGDDIATVTIYRPNLAGGCIRATGGFDDVAGSFAGLAFATTGLLHLGETLSLSAQYGVRLQGAQFGVTRNTLFGKAIDLGAAVYGQRFRYNEDRESSILAFQPHIPLFNGFAPDALLNYASNSYGMKASAGYAVRPSFYVGVEYNYDVSDFMPQTGATSDFFGYVRFDETFGANLLNSVRTSQVTPSLTYRTPSTAIAVSTTIAGLGGDVHTVAPALDLRHLRAGLKRGHVIALHLHARMITGYGGESVPPFDRQYMGGEDDLRGFDSWSVGPIAYVPSEATINVLNNNGTPLQGIIRDPQGNPVVRDITTEIPIYRPVTVGGDTKVVANFEYRIPLKGPLTLALFTDAGSNRITFRDQLQLTPYRIGYLNATYPTAGFSSNPSIQPGTQKIRVSTGAELQYFLKSIHAPLRLYWAYNPRVYQGNLQPPVAADRALVPNAATYQEALDAYGSPIPFRERRWIVRLAIGRTF